uniref:FtsX-like permease family protein n=1 Tax=Candidatus Enterococcus willemsii TaxID=1857215 RepID=UPI00403F8A48
MLFKIIWRSFLRQTRNYVVYFLCMMSSVMIFYSFSAMTYDQPLVHRAQQDIQIGGVLSLGNFIVAIVVLFFMLSANQFFIQQRQKEIGLYHLYGIRKSRIIAQLIAETLVLNAVSLFVGILMGIVFSKFFAMILIKAMDLNIVSRFFISWPSILTTTLIFLLAVVFISIQNIWILRKKQLVELFHQKKITANSRIKLHWSGYIFALMSVGLIGIGYYIATNFVSVTTRYIQQTEDNGAFLWMPLFIFTACVFGTYLFFRFGMQMVFATFTKWRKYNQSHLRFIIFNNARHLMYKSWRTLSLISIVLGIAISMIGGAIGAFAITYQITETNHPTDFQLSPTNMKVLEQFITNSGGQISQKFILPLKAIGYYERQENELTEENYETIEVLDVISESSFQKLKAVIPKLPDVHIEQENGAVLLESDIRYNQAKTDTKRKISLPDSQDVYVEQIYGNLLGNSLVRYGFKTMIVTDNLYQELEGIPYQVVYANAKGYNEEQFYQQYIEKFPGRWGEDIVYHYDYQEGVLTGKIEHKTPDTPDPTYQKGQGMMSRLTQVNRYLDIRSTRRQGGIFLYVTLFVGMIVLLTTAGTLMVRQFFEASREKKNYQLLQQLGIPRKALHKVVYKQIAWIFFPTMLLAVSHGSFAIYMLTQLIQDANYWVAYLFCFITIFIFTAAYLLTTNFYLRIIEEE